MGLLRRCNKQESIKSQEHNLSEFATSFVLNYHQSWGQGIEKRIEMLNKAIELADIKAKFIQEEDGKSGWTGEDIKELEKAKEFRAEIDKNFPIGSIEAEICSVINTIEKYKK